MELSNSNDLSQLSIRGLAAFMELDVMFGLEKNPIQNSVPRIVHRRIFLEDDDQFQLNKIGAILERAWWGRIWVVQDLSLARISRLYLGYDLIPGNRIRSFLNILDSLNRGFVPKMLNHRPWAMFEIRNSVQIG